MNRWLTSTVDTYIKYFGTSPNPIVFDVGSRDGDDGVELAQRIYAGNDIWSDAKIVLFECNPPQQEVIRRNYPRATLITEAISNVPGKEVEFLQIHGDKNYIGSSSMDLDRVNESWVRETSKIKVMTRRLDHVLFQHGYDKKDIDIMKVDVEHYTWEALESLGEYLRNVKVFHLETEIKGVARNKTNLDIAYYMQERGYLCTSLEGEWLPDIQDQVWVRL